MHQHRLPLARIDTDVLVLRFSYRDIQWFYVLSWNINCGSHRWHYLRTSDWINSLKRYCCIDHAFTELDHLLPWSRYARQCERCQLAWLIFPVDITIEVC